MNISLAVIASLLLKLQDANLSLVSVDQNNLSGTERQRRQEAKKLIRGSRSCILYVDNSESIRRKVYLNSSLLINKFVVKYSLDADIESAIIEFKTQWLNKK